MVEELTSKGLFEKYNKDKYYTNWINNLFFTISLIISFAAIRWMDLAGFFNYQEIELLRNSYGLFWLAISIGMLISVHSFVMFKKKG